MKFVLFLPICFSFLCSFAQTSPMGYFYQGLCEEAIPDFVALAVLERQHCPLPIPKHEGIGDVFSKEYRRYMDQICTSRYRIIRFLDAVSDTLKKEYFEAIELPVFPYHRHRPMLIFGKNNDILGREEMSDYFFFPYFRNMNITSQSEEFSKFLADSKNIYALHSIGTPYYDARNFDYLDTMYYADYLLPRMKFEAEAAGKNLGELLLRLSYGRTPIRAAKIKNAFAVLGTIERAHPAGEPGQQRFHELRLAIEIVIKNDAEINSNTAIYMDKARLLEKEKPFYFFGDLKNGVLVIDSLSSTRDTFVFGDTLYDISMGIPFEELLSYFLPPDVSGIAEKSAFIDNKYEQRREKFKKEDDGYPGEPFLFNFTYDRFRCSNGLHSGYDTIKECPCKPYNPKKYGIWGRK